MNKAAPLIVLVTISLLNALSAHAAPSQGLGSESRQHQFTQMDANNDGYVSYDEFLAWHGKWLEWKFQHTDSDADGYISSYEFQPDNSKGKSEKSMREEMGQGSPLK